MTSFRIKFLNINQSYFMGKVVFDKQEFTINIQNERRGKIMRLPFDPKSDKERFIVRFTGPREIYVEDYLKYDGRSEWIEIDSDEITYFIADHQDEFDTLEIVDE